MMRLGRSHTVICYCGECGRPLNRAEAAHVAVYRKRIGRRLAVMVLVWLTAGLVLGADVTCLVLMAVGAWKP